MSAKHSTDPKAILSRIMQPIRVNEVTACWEWTKGKGWAGYGLMKTAGRMYRVHRVMYEIKCGPIPGGLSVLHRCDNPPCCNPDHLFLGTAADNVADRDAKGRHRAVKGDQHWMRKNPERSEFAFGGRRGNPKLTKAEMAAARAEVEAGETQTAVAKKYGLTQSGISRLVNRGK